MLCCIGIDAVNRTSKPVPPTHTGMNAVTCPKSPTRRNADETLLPSRQRCRRDSAQIHLEYLRQIFNPKRDTPLNSLENLFAGIEAMQKK
jgi:hypothetical protein